MSDRRRNSVRDICWNENIIKHHVRKCLYNIISLIKLSRLIDWISYCELKSNFIEVYLWQWEAGSRSQRRNDERTHWCDLAQHRCDKHSCNSLDACHLLQNTGSGQSDWQLAGRGCVLCWIQWRWGGRSLLHTVAGWNSWRWSWNLPTPDAPAAAPQKPHL